jgi:hypothetical protein
MTDPTPSPSPVGRRPLLLEGLTIVLSILLAFAIEAWWDTNRDRKTEARLVNALQAELSTNRDRLEAILARGERSLQRSYDLIDVIGPSTDLVPIDSLGLYLGTAFSIGAARLEVTVTERFLAEADFEEDGSRELFDFLSQLRSWNEKYVADGLLFEQARNDAATHLNDVIPGAWATAGAGGHSPTDFPVDPQQLQRDPRLEALIGGMAVRLRVLNNDAEELLTWADSAASLIGPR